MNNVWRTTYCVSAEAAGSDMASDMSIVLEKLDEALTNSSKVAAALGEKFLVYLIDMAVLHVRKSAIHRDDSGQYHSLKASTPLNAKLKHPRFGALEAPKL